MSKLIETSFSSYDLSPEEAMQGATFNQMNLMFIQNEISKVAELKIMLEYNDSQSFIQNEAMYNGQIKILRYLLDCHHAAVAEQRQLAALAAQ